MGVVMIVIVLFEDLTPLRQFLRKSRINFPISIFVRIIPHPVFAMAIVQPSGVIHNRIKTNPLDWRSRVNRGFRFLLDKEVAFITLARNRYFLGTDGLRMDVGATVAALEYAAVRTALLIGKPAREVFLGACQSMGVTPEETIVIGDDLEADIGGALAAGCAGVRALHRHPRARHREAGGIRD